MKLFWGLSCRTNCFGCCVVVILLSAWPTTAGHGLYTQPSITVSQLTAWSLFFTHLVLPCCCCPLPQALLQRQRLAAEAVEQEQKEEEFHLQQAQVRKAWCD